MYSREDKIHWLSELDGRIRLEILDAHEGAPTEPFNGYNADTPGDTELLAPWPYEVLYLHYLGAQVDYHNAEYARYNNAMALFANVFAEYADWYNRGQMPMQKNTVRI